MSAPSGASVIIAAHTLDRWSWLCEAIEAVRKQEPAPAEVIVAVDHNARLYEQLYGRYSAAKPEGAMSTGCEVSAASPPVTLVHSTADERGAGSTRNRGVAAASSEYVVFLDDDARPEPGWLAALISPLDDPSVVGVGGFVDPLWEGAVPHWYPPEFLWAVGATYRGMPTSRGPIRNVWAENMAVRRSQFLAVGGFREGYGKTGKVSAPEDTDFCLRLASSVPGSTWLFEPRARVGHRVPRERSTLRFLVRRSFNEGAAKAQMASFLAEEADPGARLTDERRHAVRTIPAAVLAEILRAASGEVRAAKRAAVSVVALAAAGSGYLRGLVSVRSSRRLARI